MAAILVLVVPLLTLEADARGGGGGGHGGGGGGHGGVGGHGGGGHFAGFGGHGGGFGGHRGGSFRAAHISGARIGGAHIAAHFSPRQPFRRLAAYRRGRRGTSEHCRSFFRRQSFAACRNRHGPSVRQRLGPRARGCRGTRGRSRSPCVRQPRHRQRRAAIAIRTGALPRCVLWFSLALVAWRRGPRLVRTAVLALRLLRPVRLRLLAVCL